MADPNRGEIWLVDFDPSVASVHNFAIHQAARWGNLATHRDLLAVFQIGRFQQAAQDGDVFIIDQANQVRILGEQLYPALDLDGTSAQV